MAQFQAFAPNVMVTGASVLSVVNGMGSFKQTALEILGRHGIKNPEAAAWYPQQAWLDAFREINQSIGAATLRQIGLSIPANAKFPPGIDTIEKALASIDVAYHMNHRGGEIGHLAYSKSGERQATVTCKNPYPCDFDRGIVEAMAARFKPGGAMVKVQHDAAHPCRKTGGESCTYLVSW